MYASMCCWHEASRWKMITKAQCDSRNACMPLLGPVYPLATGSSRHCCCSTDEREQSRVQRLLLEGMKIVYDGRHPESGEVYEDDACPTEVYGHLAAALRPQMVVATDERLAMLASSRFFSTVAFAFKLGADTCEVVLLLTFIGPHCARDVCVVARASLLHGTQNAVVVSQHSLPVLCVLSTVVQQCIVVHSRQGKQAFVS